MQKNFKVKINFAAYFHQIEDVGFIYNFLLQLCPKKMVFLLQIVVLVQTTKIPSTLATHSNFVPSRRNFIQFSVIPNFTSAFQRNKRNVACTDFSRWILTSLGLPLAHKVTSRSLGKFQLLDSFFVFTADRVLNYEYSGFSSHRGYE